MALEERLMTWGRPPSLAAQIVYASGSSVEEAREQGWLFDRAERNSFWSQFEQLYGGLADGNVEWSALGVAVPSWIVMLLIVNLDSN